MKTYISKYAKFILTIKSPVFEEINGKNIMREKAKTIYFTGGKYSTNDEKEMALIEKTSAFGVDVFDPYKQQNEAKKAEEIASVDKVQIHKGAITSATGMKETNVNTLVKEPAKESAKEPAKKEVKKPGRKPKK